MSDQQVLTSQRLAQVRPRERVEVFLNRTMGRYDDALEAKFNQLNPSAYNDMSGLHLKSGMWYELPVIETQKIEEDTGRQVWS